MRHGWTLKPKALNGGRLAVSARSSGCVTMCNWAVEQGYAEMTPSKGGNGRGVRSLYEERHVIGGSKDEDEQLLRHADPHRALITAALETGCRKGELLSLRWRHVSEGRTSCCSKSSTRKRPSRATCRCRSAQGTAGAAEARAGWNGARS